MAVRPIDAVQVLHNINLHHRPTPVSEFESGFNDGLNQAMWEITHVPTLTQPNEPLTLEELREMDEPTPVWWEKAGYWCLCERGFIITPNGNIYEFEENDWIFYRRPPEEVLKDGKDD